MDIVLENYSWLYIWMGVSILVVVLHFYKGGTRERAVLKFANVPVLKKLKTKAGGKRDLFQLSLKIIALLLICLAGGRLALASRIPSESQNVVLAIDKSFSMMFEDYPPNRLEAAKAAIYPFIEKITEKTKVAIVAFGPRIELVQNFTNNKEELKSALERIEVTDRAGTAVGDSLFFSSQILPRGERGTIVLLTDGRNNVGILLDDALKTVKSKGIIVHAIGMGSTVKEYSEVNEEALKAIAAETGGIASVSTTDIELKDIYDRITGVTLQKRVETKKFFLSPFLLIVAVALVILELVLGSTVFDILP
jgi:Ca-activated chloride channel family protein